MHNINLFLIFSSSGKRLNISGLWDPKPILLPSRYVFHCHSQAEAFSQKAHACNSELVVLTLPVKTGRILMASVIKQLMVIMLAILFY